MADKGTCRSCGAAILWAKTAAGKSIPLDDAAPIEGGTVILNMGPGGRETAVVETKAEIAQRLKCTEPAGRTAYVVHWATCPTAAQHRKPKAKEAQG